MSCLEMPRSPVPDFLGEPRRAFNDAETMQPRAPGGGARRRAQRRAGEDAGRAARGRLSAQLQFPHAQHALARIRANVDGRGDYARRDGRLHASHQLHAVPEFAAHLSRRLPRQLRLLRAGASSRSGAQLCRPQLHPRRLAGGALRPGDRHRRRGRGWRSLPPHVHQHDYASALRRGHQGRAARNGSIASNTCRCPSCPIRRR